MNSSPDNQCFIREKNEKSVRDFRTFTIYMYYNQNVSVILATIIVCELYIYTQHETKFLFINIGTILYSYLMPVCSIVKTITPRCRGRPNALLHKAEGRVQ